MKVMKEKIVNMLQKKVNSMSKQECTLTDEELLNAVDNLDNMLKSQKKEEL